MPVLVRDRLLAPGRLHRIHMGSKEHRLQRWITGNGCQQVAAGTAGGSGGVVFFHLHAQRRQSFFNVAANRLLVKRGAVQCYQIRKCLHQSFFVHPISPFPTNVL